MRPDFETFLVLGGGGREHALVQWLKSSSSKIEIVCAPGNAGMEDDCILEPDIKTTEFARVKTLIEKHNVNVVIPGDEQAIADGITDFLERQNYTDLYVVAPGKDGALLEASKSFAKQFMSKNEIPTAHAVSFNQTTREYGEKYIRNLTKFPKVLKADGLAAGKGVTVCNDQEEALQELNEMLDGKFGEASKDVLVEDFLDGNEFSVFALFDGEDFVILPTAKDYKKLYDGDTGPNTGGMGAISPAPISQELMDKTIETIVKPTFEGLREKQTPYKGFLYFGLMEVDGDPFIVEYNVRLGDPETQAILPRIDTDPITLIKALIDQRLGNISPVKFYNLHTATVVAASSGYPGKYSKGKPITIQTKNLQGLNFAGVANADDASLVTAGGRVLSFTAVGGNLKEAVKNVYINMRKVHYEGIIYRIDIGD